MHDIMPDSHTVAGQHAVSCQVIYNITAFTVTIDPSGCQCNPLRAEISAA